ncbi:TPA: carboxylate--amine ligase, partial [Enterococcus faecium]
MNILILSCGRRCELVNAFKTALNNNEMEGKIIGADCSELAPALYMCDEKIVLPKVS